MLFYLQHFPDEEIKTHKISSHVQVTRSPQLVSEKTGNLISDLTAKLLPPDHTSSPQVSRKEVQWTFCWWLWVVVERSARLFEKGKADSFSYNRGIKEDHKILAY